MHGIDSADDDGKSNDDPNDLFKHEKHADSISPSTLHLLYLPTSASSRTESY